MDINIIEKTNSYAESLSKYENILIKMCMIFDEKMLEAKKFIAMAASYEKYVVAINA